MAQLLEMPKLSDTMKEGVLAQVAEEGRRQGRARRPGRRGRDRQGHHGLRVVRRGRPPEAAGQGRRHGAARRAHRHPRQGRRGHHRGAGRRREAKKGGKAAAAKPRGQAGRGARGQARAGRQARPGRQARGPRGQAAAAPQAGPGPPPRRQPAPRPAPAPRANGASGGKILASPLARRLATDLGVDLRGIQGTGPGGRIVERDVKAAADGGAQAPRAARGRGRHAASRGGGARAPGRRQPAPPAGPRAPRRDPPGVGHARRRGSAACRCRSCARPSPGGWSSPRATIPHFYLTADADMEAAMAFREQVKEVHGAKLSVNDLIIKAAALALRRVPEANASLHGRRHHPLRPRGHRHGGRHRGRPGDAGHPQRRREDAGRRSPPRPRTWPSAPATAS